MAGGSDERFADDEPTEPGRGSLLANALRNLRLSLHEIDRDLESSTEAFENLEEHERVHALRGIAARLGELGDVAHDARRAVRALADEPYPLISF